MFLTSKYYVTGEQLQSAASDFFQECVVNSPQNPGGGMVVSVGL